MCAERVKGCGSNLKEQKRRESGGETTLKLEDVGKELGSEEEGPTAVNECAILLFTL